MSSEDEDKRWLQDVFKTSSSRRMFATTTLFSRSVEDNSQHTQRLHVFQLTELTTGRAEVSFLYIFDLR